MPIYEYRCESCGKEFEEWQKITDPPTHTCRACGGKASRLISQSTFVLKGTGWYVTDYARKDGASNSAPAKKRDGVSESKKSDSGSSSTTSSSGSGSGKSSSPASGDK